MGKLLLKKGHYKAIFNNLLDAVVETDRNGIIINCNNTVKQLFGYKQGELIGKEIDKLFFHQFQKKDIKNIMI